MNVVVATGIFCLEGEWETKLTDRTSVRPEFELLEHACRIPFVHRDVATVEEFEHLLVRWTEKQYSRYSIGYFGFHGTEAGLWVGRAHYPLERFVDLLRGRLAGKVVYFASCGTFDRSEEELARVRAELGARALCGYAKDVGWIESAAFDLLLLDALNTYSRIDAPFKYLQANHGELCERLGFKAIWN